MLLKPGEIEIDTSTVAYFPPNGLKYKGKLTVTNRRLVYHGVFDASFEQAMASSHSVKLDGEGQLEIDRKRIRGVESNTQGLTKRCTLTLADGSRHAFDYGAANVDQVMASFERPGSLSLLSKLFRIAACTLILLAVSDIVGAILSTVIDVSGSARLLPIYLIWTALGMITGFFIHYFAVGLVSPESEAWTDPAPNITSTGMLVCATAIPILAGLSELSKLLGGSSDSVYVPDNGPLTITYFIAVAAGVAGHQIFLRWMQKG